MLNISHRRTDVRDGISRRRALITGGAGLLGMSLPGLFDLEASQNDGVAFEGRAKSVIFLFLFGGPSQLETFDLKPDSPAETRGPYLPIASRTPGLLIGEHLPRLADVSDKYCVVRTMTHSFNDHSGAGHYLQTGKRWHVPVGGGFLATPDDWPSMGSVVEYLTQHSPGGMQHELPSYAVVPNWLGRLQENGQYRRPGQYAGWLGQSFNPLTTAINKRDLNDNPYWRDCTDDELSFQLDGLGQEVSLETMRRRVTLLEQFEAQRKQFAEPDANVYDRFRERALALVTSDDTRTALNIGQESDAVRDQYGRHLFGQSCLMARRLVEAGVRFVTVHYDCVDGYSWDSHRNSDDVGKHLLPTFDQGCAALLADLDDRGLLDETLVVAVGEMGRTPKANAQWGRDHWSTLFPALIAGAGAQGGTTYGSSDRIGAYVEESPVSPEDLAATIYWRLGIDPHLMIPDRTSRPVPITEGGAPIKEIF